MKSLPPFAKIHESVTQEFIIRALNHGTKPEESSLVELISYPDHHFRAIFRLDYFTLAPGQAVPSKSQWNTLKKRMKRMNRLVFVFKDCGELNGQGYIDFGFLPA